MINAKATRFIDAPLEQVWELLSDQAAMTQWTKAKVTVIEEGDPAPHGVGCVREIRAAGLVTVHEKIIEFNPPTVLAYTVVKGFPLTDYRAEVRLTPEGAGTRVDWSGRGKAPKGLGVVFQLLIRSIFWDLLRGLDAHLKATNSRP